LDTVDKTINYFTAEFTNPTEFKKIKELAVETIKKTGNKSVEGYIQSGHLSTHDFLIYLGANKLLGDKGIKTQIVNITLKLLVENFIVNPLDSVVVSAQMRYKANMFSAVLKTLDVIHNIIFGFNFIIEKYRKSVLKIEHTNSDDEPSIGTGFLIFKKNKGQYIVTNKHVVEGYKKLRLLDVDDNEMEFGNITLHPAKDLALVELKSTIDSPSFQLNMTFDIMSEIITIGYPSIPMTKYSYQVVHRGEINSMVEDYESNKIFLFSAKTSSGNSGSPIIDKSGTILGIVTQELFEEAAFRQKGKLPYYAAIPSIEIRDFIKD
jgi:S1-C subfamily serine protease